MRDVKRPQPREISTSLTEKRVKNRARRKAGGRVETGSKAVAQRLTLGLAKFFGVYRMELRLIAYQRSYWLLNLAWIGLVAWWSSSQFETYETAQAVLLVNVARFTLVFCGMIGMLLSALSAARSRQSRFDMIEATLPTGSEVMIGRWLGVTTMLLPFLIAPLVVAWRVGPAESFLAGLPVFLGETLLTLTVTTGIAWWMFVHFGTKRLVFLPLLFLFILSSILPNITNGNGKEAPISNLFNYPRMIFGTHSELWGRLTQGELPTLYNLFYVAVVLVLAGWIGWRVSLRRFYRHPPGLVGFTQAALVAAFVVAWGYGTITWDARHKVRADEASLRANPATWILPHETPFVVDAYDLTVDLTTEMPRFTAQLEVTNRSETPLDTLEFTLYHEFTITRSSVPATHDDNFVRLTLQPPLEHAESLRIALDYEGAVWRYEATPIAPPEPVDFVHPDGVRLTAGMWYPFPGRGIVGLREINSFDGTGAARSMLDVPARFQVRVMYSGDLKVASNLVRSEDADTIIFESQGATWAELIAAPRLVSEQVGPVTLISSELEIGKFRPLVEQYYVPFLTHLQKIYPDVQHLTLFVSNPGKSTLFNVTRPPTAESLYAMQHPNALWWLKNPHIEPFSAYFPVGMSIIGGLLSDVQWILGDNLTMFLWAHYQSGGDAEKMRAALEHYTGGWFTPNVDVGDGQLVLFDPYIITRALMNAYDAHGEAAVLALLRQLRAEFATLRQLPEKELAAWIEENISSVEAAEQ